MLYERPMHMKTVLERYALAEQPTQRTEAIRLPKVTAKLPVTEPLLPIDKLGRSYLVSFVKWQQGLLWDDTLYHCERLVERYRELSRGHYPQEIVLPAQRYFVRKVDRFYPRELSACPIPFKYEDATANYEVLVRGEV